MAIISYKALKEQTEQASKKQEQSKDKVDELEQELGKKLKENEHKTRSWLTTGFILGLFSLIILSSFYVVYHNEHVIDLAIKAKENGITVNDNDLRFLSFESVYSLLFNSLGTSLGFIIGYYFKEKSSK